MSLMTVFAFYFSFNIFQKTIRRFFNSLFCFLVYLSHFFCSLNICFMKNYTRIIFIHWITTCFGI